MTSLILDYWTAFYMFFIFRERLALQCAGGNQGIYINRGVTKKCCAELKLNFKTDEQMYHACSHPTKDWNVWKDEFLACCLRGRALQYAYMGDDDEWYEPGGCWLKAFLKLLYWTLHDTSELKYVPFKIVTVSTTISNLLKNSAAQVSLITLKYSNYTCGWKPRKSNS